MTRRVLIIGGYGNFGSHIAKNLAREESIQLIIAGRNISKANDYAEILTSKIKPEAASLDIDRNLEQSLAGIKPDIVIHTSGPYQSQDYHVAKACIKQGCHYVDLADGRQFVSGVESLDKEAKEKGVLICSGASSVPCLTSALIDHYKIQFKSIEKIEYGIATAQLTNRGLATTSAVLSYAGKPFKTLIDGKMQDVYGWHNLKFRKFWGLNNRLLGNCDIPDLEIFPLRYPELKTIRFEAGLELKALHIGLWLLSWLVRLRLIPSLQGSASHLLKISRIFDYLGKDDSGFYMHFYGADDQGKQKELEFNIVAKHGDGLYIPSMPAILMAKKLVSGEIADTGATPCVGFITLDEYLEALREFDISWDTI
ncbi:MAG: saccharopine dehydrogenase NADP-binding domain-containing protein [Gammaproteobacteria bacterium]|nr:saccharopine dehydrogenase NADP-binding domain-containing protein [Pseudomonadales bacterium]